jgi:SPW repeat
MMDIRKTLAAQWKDAVNLVLGLWLIVSPWVLHFATDRAPLWNASAVGLIIAVAALAALISFHRWEEWIEAALGLWLIVSPYLLSFTTQMNATVNHVIVGLIVAALAVWAAATAETARRAMR